MKLFLTLFFLFAVNSFISAQDYTKEQLDSLYAKFIRIRSTDKDRIVKPVEIDIADRKCGFGIVSDVTRNLRNFTPEQRSVLAKILQRPEKDTSIVSPSGFFRIHYDRTGNEAPNYNPTLTADENAMQVALAADSAYNFEVNFLGYPPPPSDNGEGGDGLYDIYITTAGGFYGFTQPESFLGGQKYSSHIQIHYAYPHGSFYTEGLSAMRVTVAHEMHHAIQIGNYTGDKTDIDLFFYEITSTSMEEFVYDDVNDYYAYMHSYFNNPGKPLGRSQTSSDGYDLAIWNIFLRDNFDYNIIKRQWELLPQMRALNAIAASLSERESTFGSELNKFGIWTFFTDYRAVAGEYFEEAEAYPKIRSITTIDFHSNSPPVLVNAKPTSNNFITFVSSIIPGDTLVSLISNTDYISGVDSINKTFDFEYTLSDDSIDGSTRLTYNYFAKLNVAQPTFWGIAEMLYNQELLNYQVIRRDSSVFPSSTGKDLYAYPNPFYYNKRYRNDCNCVEILIDPETESNVDFNVYTPAMELVYSASLPFVNTISGRKVIRWTKIRDLDLASGVYIYVTKIGDETSAGKLVIFNE
jgi:hypothetical protein